LTQSLKTTRPASPAKGSTGSHPTKGRRQAQERRRANQLDGSAWTRHSISVWGDIRKGPEEQSLKHPAMFPVELAARLIRCFTNEDDGVILDPFAGSGSTLLAAEALGKTGVGFDVSEEYVTTAMARTAVSLPAEDGTPAGQRMIYAADAARLLEYVAPESVDFAVTSPPYWDILLQRRTADYKDIRHYGDSTADLGKIGDYNAFLAALSGVFEKVYLALKPGKYCCAVVMDIRKKDRFYPLHADLASRMQEIGFIFDDIIIWDRGHEYNNLRPLGYPYVFRINKVHEYILIFKKPLRD
jgi:DNA modification methylase